jgi:hypothetical protein
MPVKPDQIESTYHVILELLKDRDVEPGDALAACLAVAARIAKFPPRGMAEMHVNGFLKLCKSTWQALAAAPKAPPTVERH